MKKYLKLLLLILNFQFAFAGLVAAKLTAQHHDDYKGVAVSTQIGIADVTIHYSRPGVKKRKGTSGEN